MKFFKSFIIIKFLLCLTIETINGDGTSNAIEDEKIMLNKFLSQMQIKKDIFTTRTVKINEELISIENFFESSPSLGSKEDKIWQVTDDGVYKAGNLMYRVLSCEYSEYIFNMVNIMLAAISAFYKNHIYEHRTDIQNYFYHPIKDVLPNMILTLIGLLKYTKHYSQKYHEFLNTLLSWYVIIIHSDYKDINKSTRASTIYHIDFTPTIIYQVEKYSKSFILNDCQKAEDFKTHVHNMNAEYETYTKIDEFKDLYDKKVVELSKLTCNIFLYRTYKIHPVFVLTLPRDNFSLGIRTLLGQQTASKMVKVKWDSKTTGELSHIHEEHISKNASGIHSLLKYERIFLQSITKIILGFISNELNNILCDSQLSESTLDTQLQSKLISSLDSAIELFHKGGQPTYLINNISIIRTELWILANNKKSLDDKIIEIGKYIAKINELKIDVLPGEGLVKLKSFLMSLSGKLICAKLHPAVSNLYWDKLYFAPTKISHYVIDLKYLQKTYEVLPKWNKICKKLSMASGRLQDITSSIIECEKNVESDDSDNIAACFNSLNTKYTRLKIKIDEIVSSIYEMFNFNWKKLLLVIVYNINNLQSYGTNKKEAMKIVGDLNILHNTIIDYFDMGFHLTCRSLPGYSKIMDTEVFEPDTLPSQIQYRGMNRKLSDVIAYQEFFKSVNELIGKIVDSRIEPELTLYLDGDVMKFEKVYEIYKSYSLDQLQINYDYFKFFVRWLLAVVYSRIIEITKEIINSDTSNVSRRTLARVCFIGKLELIFREFMNLPLYISMPVGNILDSFICVLKSYDGTDNENLENYITVLENELEKLGYVPGTTTIRKRIFSIYIQQLIEIIKNLLRIYQTHQTTTENAITNIGVDLNDLYMMFHEWN